MSVHMSLSVIDRHLVRQPLPGLTNGVPTVAIEKTYVGREEPVRQMLPAFYVDWRDGPSPFDAHKGDTQCSVDKAWASRQNFVLDTGVGVSPSSSRFKPWVPREVAMDPEVLTAAIAGTYYGECAPAGCTSDRFHSYTRPAVLRVQRQLSDHDPTEWAAAAKNPARDLADLRGKLDDKRSGDLLRNAQRDRVKLYNICVRDYPYGALGIRESPYGHDTGCVYADHKLRMERQHAKRTRKLLGYADREPEDHLRGAVMIRGDPAPPMHVADIAPQDHLLGGVHTIY